MNTQDTNSNKNSESSQKHPRGSKQVHSKRDNSTHDGFKPEAH